jgi:hypothetical protein
MGGLYLKDAAFALLHHDDAHVWGQTPDAGDETPRKA